MLSLASVPANYDLCSNIHLALQAVKPPAKFKRKTVYFIKNQKTALTAENIKKNVSFAFLSV